MSRLEDHVITEKEPGMSKTDEKAEIEEMYPRFIREAEAEGRKDAMASFRLAVERETHHRHGRQSSWTEQRP